MRPEPADVTALTLGSDSLVKTSDPSVNLERGEMFVTVYSSSEVPCPDDKAYRVSVMSVDSRADGIAGLYDSAHAEDWDEALDMAALGLAFRT